MDYGIIHSVAKSLVVRPVRPFIFRPIMMRNSCVLLIAVVSLAMTMSNCDLCAGETPAPVFPPPPRLAAMAEELAATKTRADFAAIKDEAMKAADPLVEKPIVLPDGFGSWVFYYACADDGMRLRMNTPADHECPKCHKHFIDERTIAAYRGIQHSEAERAALKLAWAYAYSGGDKYAAQVKRILLKFADDYPNYPGRIDRWNRRGFFAPLGGRRRVQSLEEAEGILPLAKAYDLTRASPLWSDAERKHVENDFFRLTAETLLRFPMGLENRQAWYNAALMAIASVLSDAALVEKALHARGGFFDQLNRGVDDDGFWWEGTMAYQSYVVQPMIETVEIARRMGIQLQDTARFKLLLGSPLRATYPNGTFPCINDSDPANIHLFGGSFEWAWKTYQNPLFAQALAWENPTKLSALLGPEAKPVYPFDEKTADLASVGLLFLRVGKRSGAACIVHHYGSPGGDASGHGHWDKLNITLFANGREWLADIGRLGYEHKEYKTWAKRTIAHNTLTLDQSDQRVNSGKLLWMKSGDDFAASASESTESYANTTLRRYLYLTPSMLVDVFDVKTDHPATLDLAAHTITDPLVSAVETPSQPLASLGADNGYQHLKDIRAWTPPANSRWVFPAGKDAAVLHVLLAAVPGEQIFTATGIGYRPDQAAPCLIRRRIARETRFAAVYDISGKGDYVRSIEVLDGEIPRVRIGTSEKVQELKFERTGVVLSPPE